MKLAKDFETNERLFAFSHDLDAKLLEIEEEAQRSMAAADHNVAMAEARVRALGGYVPPRTNYGDSTSKVEKARRQLEETDQKYKAEGDRITTLLIANKCQAPEHVTSWYTYSEQNPNRITPERASDKK